MVNKLAVVLTSTFFSVFHHALLDKILLKSFTAFFFAILFSSSSDFQPKRPFTKPLCLMSHLSGSDRHRSTEINFPNVRSASTKHRHRPRQNPPSDSDFVLVRPSTFSFQRISTRLSGVLKVPQRFASMFKRGLHQYIWVNFTSPPSGCSFGLSFHKLPLKFCKLHLYFYDFDQRSIQLARQETGYWSSVVSE